MKSTATIAVLLSLVLALAACSSTGASHAPASSGGGGMQTESVAYSFRGDSTSGSVGSDESAHPNAQVDARKLKRHAQMTIEVDDEDDIEPTIDKAREMAEASEGYVASESTNAITMMVPTGDTENFLDRLTTLGEVTDRSLRVDDVTSQYVDLEIRIENLERTRKRLQELLEQSVQVSEVLEVEKELSRVTMQLEQYKGQMRTMSRDTTYAHVQLRVEESVVPGPVGWIFYGGYKAVKWLFVWD